MYSSSTFKKIQHTLKQKIARSGADVAIVMRSLNNDHFLFYQPDLIFHAASTMKIAVMIEVFAQAEAGKLLLTETLPIHNMFSSIIDGSPYTLELEYDEDRQIAQSRTQTIQQLCEAMITVSSNLATNLLMQKVGITYIQARLDAIGAGDMQVLRGLEDNKAFEQGMSNTTTANALLIQLEALSKHTMLTSSTCEAMIAMLTRQKWIDAIPAGVRANTTVANKTGEITSIHHDASIVYAETPYVLVILTRGIQKRETSAHLIADLTRMIDGVVR